MKVLTLHLSDIEILLLRKVVNDLGHDDREVISLQLKIANAILDSTVEQTE